ncbi:permease family-domain-containing protein [Boeremia exigua]|uniref:permease family-domain-containing protein n=1 Tax=Boeremia exigua TaxID=749465 RepID=UPI001E8DEB06|nr:permease family-domain-containing protein [Boeremia exigua]KAH6615200.1 permease family-domain-containing protein [Boeremia exigua]
MEALRMYRDGVNSFLGTSTFGRVFRLEGCGHEKEIINSRFTTEIRAGLTTFFTMAYVISVNASILSDTGGNCVCNDAVDPLCMNNVEYAVCVQDLRRSLVTATAAISGFSSILFGFLTNMPVALAPGMGLNAYFAYQVVGFHGRGIISYNLALTAVFIEGFIFIGLSLVGMRQWLVKVIPNSLKIATACGIGLFLALIGLSNSTGIGAISGARDTPLQLAGCADEYKDDLGICTSHKMTSPTLWIGLTCGGIVTSYLMIFKVKSAMIIGILIVSITAWPRGTNITYFPNTSIGNDRWDYFKKVAFFQPIDSTLNTLDWNVSQNTSHFVLALFTFLYVDIIDCTATLYSMARFCCAVDHESGDFPRSTLAYCTDAFCISVGALLGVSPVTAYIESGAGIAEGGKTGLTAIVAGLCFLVSMFFAPIFASIPPWATGCTLVIVGCLMMRQVTSINWRYIGDAIPAFVTLMFIPFSYSAAYGLIAGLLIYTALNGMAYLTQLISGGRIVPDDADAREYWSLRPGGRDPWFVRAGQDIADRLNGDHKNDASSIRSGTSSWRHERIGSKSSNRELSSLTIKPNDPTDPRLEKVLRKL